MCSLPQIYKLLKSRNSIGISLWTYILVLLGAVCAVIYGFIIGAIFVASLGIYDIVAACIVIFLIKKYKKVDIYPKTLI